MDKLEYIEIDGTGFADFVEEYRRNLQDVFSISQYTVKREQEVDDE